MTLGPPAASWSYAAESPVALAQDIDGDGEADVASANSTNSTIFWSGE